MKFHHVPLGSRFTLDGDLYIKTSPLVGELESNGKQRLIRRAAMVEVDERTASTPLPDETPCISAHQAHTLFDEFYRQCLDCLSSAREHLEPDQAGSMEKQLQQARQEFFRQLASGRVPDS